MNPDELDDLIFNKNQKLSPTAMSCLFTAGVASRYDKRQEIPSVPSIPSLEIRQLRAKLILEEALETIRALGLTVNATAGPAIISTDFIRFDESPDKQPFEEQLEAIIDGCCDTIYVATGCLCAVGVPDIPHLAAVCNANDAKFPGGKAVINPDTGKYLKPQGWVGPKQDHIKLIKEGVTDLNAFSQFIMRVCSAPSKSK